MKDAERAQRLLDEGVALQRSGRLEEALKRFRLLLKSLPGHPVALTTLAMCMCEMGRFGKALPLLEEAQRSAPDDWRILHGVGVCNHRLGRHQRAIEALSASLQKNPVNADARLSLGAALGKVERYEEAVATVRATIDPKRNNLRALRILTQIHAAFGKRAAQAEAAIAAWREAPERLDVNAEARLAAQYVCDWSLYEELDNDIEQRLLALDASPADDVPSPFTMLSRTENRRVHLHVARRYALNITKGVAEAPAPKRHQQKKSGKLRIGYLSGDFHDHPTMHLMAGVFREHDAEKLEFYCYSHGPDREGAYRQLLRDRAAGFREIRGHSREEAAQVIRDDKLDLLIDLKGHTFAARTDICALRPAPVQATYLGFPGTLGADFIDYAITDSMVTPESHAGDYDEVLAYHPVCYQPNDDAQSVSNETPSRDELGLPEHAVVFCSFNQFYKIDPVRFGSWLEILRRVEGSALWLWGGVEEAEQALRARASESGVAPERLVFGAKAPKPAHLARLRQADLGLDTRIYNGHTTTSDAVAVGTPVLATMGEAFASRVSGSILSALGAEELIAADEADFIERAVALGSDRAALAALKDRVRAARSTSPLFDNTGYTRDLERLYAAMIERGPGPADRTPLRLR
ncbi:MAG: tetratricopeptide repeat protein [Neomegalonema sp.]|nr:tetratricopeptide repeat protein [Neomegalonema sp.]